MVKSIDLDSTKAFTLYEACPEARCRDSLGAPTSQFPPLTTCRKCKGEGGRQRPFGSLADLQRYLEKPTTW
jgi:hypothetical protein